MEAALDYKIDFHSWLMNNAVLLREQKFLEIDAENIAEELDAMSRNERRELVSQLSVLIAHLLKWKHQAARRSRSWKNTIAIQRVDIKELLEDSPSLRGGIEEKIERAYGKAALLAEEETGIDKKFFPPVCPFSAEEMLDEDFFPEA